MNNQLHSVPPPLPEEFLKNKTQVNRSSPPPVPAPISTPPPIPPTDREERDIVRVRKPSLLLRVTTFLLIFCILLGLGWYYGDKTGYLYEYLPFIKKNWQTSPKKVETEEEALFIKALEDGDDRRPCNLDALKKSLLPIKNVNLEYGDVTPLVVATAQNDIEAVKLLLRCKADPNLGVKILPLSVAINEKNTDMVNILLAAGADTSLAMKEDVLPIIKCINTGYVDGLKALLDHGCDPNRRLDLHEKLNDVPPIFYLMGKNRANQKELCSILLKYGANVADTCIWTEDNNTTNRLDLISWCMKANIDSNLLLWLGSEILKKHKDAANYIIPENGISVLALSIYYNQDELAKILLDNGADPNICDKVEKIPPLYLALDAKKIMLIKHMLDHGVNPNTKLQNDRMSNKANDPLSRIFTLNGWSSQEVIEVLKLLLEHKSNPNASNQDGLSPLLALVVVNDSLSEKEKLQCLDILLQYNVNVNSPSSLGLTPFQGAIDKNEFLVAKALLDAGADIHQKTALLNASLLNVACLNKNEKAVDFLIANGANVNEDAKGGKSLLWCAFPDKRSELKASLACIDLLLKAGADKTNPVVLEEARKSPYREIRQLFIEDEKKKDEYHTPAPPKKMLVEVSSKKKEPTKAPILQDISSGNIEAGKKSINRIKEAVKNANDEEKILLNDLASVVTDLYSTKKIVTSAHQQNAKDEKKIISLEKWAITCMTPSKLTGHTNPSGAANARREAQALQKAIEQRQDDLKNKLNVIIESAQEMEGKLRENGREKDADVLKKSIRYFSKASR